MTRTKLDTRRLCRIADWLQDTYGQGGEATAEDHRNARDLIKFLKAHGLEIKNCTSNSQAVDPTLADILSPVKLQAELRGPRRSSRSATHRASILGLNGYEANNY